MSTNPNRVPCNNQEPVQFCGMVGKHIVQALDLLRQVSMGTKPEENDPRVWLMLDEDEAAIVPIVGDKDALLVAGKLEDLTIRKAEWWGVIAVTSCP